MEKAGDTMERGVIHISPGEGRTLRVWGEMVTYKTTSDQTGGAYSLFEVVSRPGTGPPPRPAPRGRGLLGAQWGV